MVKILCTLRLVPALGRHRQDWVHRQDPAPPRRRRVVRQMSHPSLLPLQSGHRHYQRTFLPRSLRL